MNWTNIHLLWRREMIDQLRDRRTLFTVVVLPLLLYPLLGISLIQITQFFRERPSTVWVAGVKHVADHVPLMDGDKLHPRWATQVESNSMQVVVEPDLPPWLDLSDDVSAASPTLSGDAIERARQAMVQHQAQAAVFFWQPDATAPDAERALTIYVLVNSANDASVVAARRIDSILRRWKGAVIEDNLLQQQVARQTWQILPIHTQELAAAHTQRAAIWSKILPMILVLWCLTGAFYPAVDVCAGEKERGTFETILSSPANRAEIAWGKLLTVTTFSSATALLNLASLTITALFVTHRMGGAAVGSWGQLGLPPWSCWLWIPLVIAPIALFLSAASLAAAAFARSSKEGQYYLVPLIMISMPMMMLTLVPSAHLELGTSLIPVTGMMLLMRGLIEGRYAEVLPYAAPVCLVMLLCIWGSIRWVIMQFNSESVLFRASERFGVGLWIRRMLQERGWSPTIGQAMLCFVVILLAKFFLSFSLDIPADWQGFSVQTVTILLAAIAVPAILMAVVLTKSPRRSLKLDRFRASYVAAGAFLGLALHPAFMWVSQIVMAVYPPSEGLVHMNQVMGELFAQAPSPWALLLVVAVFPAISEEIAFRGFILSGWQRLKRQTGAILVSAFCFGAAHAIFQQSIMAFAVGLVLGILAVRSGSLIPCIVYHAVHNALAVAMSAHSPVDLAHWWPIWERQAVDGGLAYRFWPALAMVGCGVVLLSWIWNHGGDEQSQTNESAIEPRSILRSSWSWLRGVAQTAWPRR